MSWLDDGKIYSFLVLSSFLCNRIGMQTVILRGELICVSLFSLLLGLQPICLNSELCNFCGISSTMYLQPPLSLKQRLCNRTGARAFDDYQDYKSGAQASGGVHNQHATFDDLRFQDKSDAITKIVLTEKRDTQRHPILDNTFPECYGSMSENFDRRRLRL